MTGEICSPVIESITCHWGIPADMMTRSTGPAQKPACQTHQSTPSNPILNLKFFLGLTKINPTRLSRIFKIPQIGVLMGYDPPFSSEIAHKMVKFHKDHLEWPFYSIIETQNSLQKPRNVNCPLFLKNGCQAPKTGIFEKFKKSPKGPSMVTI